MFGGFLTEHLGQKILVDCATVTGAQDLDDRLRALLAGRPLGLILLTHAHLDHSGGLGAVFEAWPKAKAVVHAKALRHLADPEKLWLSTKEVMGELADMYGEPRGVDPARLVPHDAFGGPGIKILETPGHAAHHLSYKLGEAMFCGEAVGCPYFLGEGFHCRPATPPRFYPEPTFNSLEALKNEPAKEAYFAHTHEKGPLRELAEAYGRQLKFWDEFLYPAWLAWPPGANPNGLLAKLTDQLFKVDPELRPLLDLDSRALEIEKYFMRNSAAGFLGFYEEARSELKAKANGL
jgi:glyoxylase-like metal-dependent hydrolase (beta-lactamase superfamily II)